MDLRVFDTVIFDLDGTLIDSLADICSSANFVLEQKGYPRRSLDEIRCFIGNGVELMVRRAVPEGTPEAEIQECLGLFRSHYSLHMAEKTAPFPGIVSLLTGLKSWGYKTAVVSNKFDAAAKELCTQYFPELIDIAVGERPGIRRKPAPDGVFAIMEQLNAAKEKTVYVGDSAVDIETAQNAGLTSIGVTWGFRKAAELSAAGADYLVTRPNQIWTILTCRNDGIEIERDGERSYEGEMLPGSRYGLTQCPYLSQCDARWDSKAFGKTGTIGSDACGPAVLVMAAGALLGAAPDFLDFAGWTTDNGYFCEGKGCYHRLIPEGAAFLGLAAEAVGRDGVRLREALKAGKAVAALVRRGHFSGGGHFILLRGMTSEGKILVADPGSLPRSLAAWSLEQVLGDLSETAGNGGPLWILSAASDEK